MAMQIMSATKARRNFTQVVEALGREGQPLYITHKGDPMAVLVGYEIFEGLLEKIEDLEDILALYQREGEERIPLEEFLAELGGKEHVSSISQPVNRERAEAAASG